MPPLAAWTWTRCSQGDWGEPTWTFRAFLILASLAVCGFVRAFGCVSGLASSLGLASGFSFRSAPVAGCSRFCVGSFPHGHTQFCRASVPRRSWFWWVCWLLFLRVGEASHPGPAAVDPWCLGVCNPSGLNGKVDQVAHLGGDVWMMSETHLSQHGFSRFKKGLHALATPWKYAVPGAPCQVKGESVTGNHTGVLLLSRFPARAVPHQFDLDLYASARLQVAGVVVQGEWVTVGMLYGIPCNANHKQAKFQTKSMLAELVDRVALQAIGPRVIAGDFNYSVDELGQLQRLWDLGFREVQDIAAWRWGRDVSGTGRGAKRIDHMWISPELQVVLQNVELHWDHWADHASIVATFMPLGESMVFDSWRQPGAFPWPQSWDFPLQWSSHLDPTVAYAQLWNQLETHAVAHHAVRGRGVSKACRGRAHTLSTRPCRYQWSPCRKGRYGELEPSFIGVSLQHARYFRQLRRFQALSQLLRRGTLSFNAQLNRDETWRAIRCSVGFPGGFGPWWSSQQLQPGFASGLPLLCPTSDTVHAMFDSFRLWVQHYEGQLAQGRYRLGKTRRDTKLNYVFKDCQADLPPQVDTLVTRIEVGIAEVCPGDCSLVLTSPTVLLDGLPVVVGGKVVEVIHHDSDQMWVHDVEGLAEGMLLTQERAVLTDREILADFRAVWEPRWNKLAHVEEGQWSQICGFVQAHFRPMDWPVSQWTGARFAAAVAKKKKHAARGPDGVSQADLAALPISAQEAFAAMFTAIEAGASWPTQLATGFVSSLAKQPDANTVDAYRPVTVYGLPYRIWSTERAKEALKTISQVVPASVQGGLPLRQAKVIWYSVAQELEQAYVDDRALHGIMMDIRKCFNAIPRLPLLNALLALGFPVSILRAWCQFVSGQVRRFKVRQSVGDPVSSVCGLPEGCALSVFGMVVVDWMLDRWLHQLRNPPLLQAFIDDWGVLFNEALELDRIWTCLTDFTQCMDLSFDMAKTRVWSTSSAARLGFRSGVLEVVHVARNLGAHQNFSRHCWNSVLQNRLSSMPPVWVKLRASLCPYSSKHVALRMLGWPKAFHGCSVVHIGAEHYKKVRSGAMKGLKADRKGANPVLHLPITHLSGDPEAWVILQTIRDARELGGFSKVEAMLGLFASSSDLPRNGPTEFLTARIERVGWQVGGNGLVQDGLGSFSLLTLGWDELLLRFTLAWGHVMHQAVCHRASFRGLHQVDLPELQQALKPYGPADMVILRCHLDGTLYTQNGSAKFQQGVTNQCPWCSQPDGFFHRAWVCPFFADCRAHVTSDQRAMVDLLPECLSAHGWPVVLPEWEVYSSLLLGPQDCYQSPVGPRSSQPGWIDLFVDGSAACPNEPKLRYAAWAVTVASGGPGDLRHEVLLGGHVSGLNQSAYRAELTAVVEALRWAKRHDLAVRIWTDCLSVYRGVRGLQQGASVRVNRPHSDLWLQLADLFADWGETQVQFAKGMSHGVVARADDPVEAWAFWHNKLVDEAAVLINNRRSDAFWQSWERLSAALVFHRKLHRAILQVLLQSGRKAMVAQTAAPAYQPATMSISEPCQAPAVWQLPHRLFARYGRENMVALHQWWSVTGARAMGNVGEMVFVSGLQLFLDFYLTTKHFGPWMYGKKWYEDEASAPVAARLPWGARTKPFLLLFHAYLKAHEVKISKKLTRPASSAIARWLVSDRLRYSVERLQELDSHVFHCAGRQLVSADDIRDFSPPVG